MVGFKKYLKEAEKHPSIAELKKRGAFLNSAIAVIADGNPEKWRFTYYSPGTGLTATVLADDYGAEFSEPSPAPNPTKNPLDVKKARAAFEKVLKAAQKEFSKYKQPKQQIIATLQNEPPETWNVNYITRTLYVITVKLDAKNAKVISSAMNSLTR